MKCAIILLVCVGAALAAPEKRFFLQNFKLPTNLLNLNFLKDAVQQLLDSIGSDPTEAMCEGACHNTITNDGSLLHNTCPLLCHSFQELVHHYNIHPDATTTAGAV